MRPLALMALLLLCGGEAAAEPLSGYAYMEPATRQLQDDDFLNPGFFLVERGALLWAQDWPGAVGENRSCQSCHGDAQAAMAGVAARYPKIGAQGAPVSLPQKIIAEISGRFDAAAPGYEAPEILALSALIALQSRGMPVTPDPAPGAAPWRARGEEIWRTRRGQLNLSCQNCHDERAGQRLRGDVISQGQANAYPIFRLTWDEPGSLHRMFTWCMEAIRSEPYAAGSAEYLALEFWLAARGAGLAVESPGVRR